MQILFALCLDLYIYSLEIRLMCLVFLFYLSSINYFFYIVALFFMFFSYLMQL